MMMMKYKGELTVLGSKGERSRSHQVW